MSASQENPADTPGTAELPADMLADILRDCDPEGCDEDWSYEPQANNILSHPRFLELCRKIVDGQNEG